MLVRVPYLDKPLVWWVFGLKHGSGEFCKVASVGGKHDS
jgi:hypothetical protein